MAKFDLIKHKELADKKRLAKNPNLGATNTTGMKIMKSAVGLIALVYIGLNVSTLPLAQPILWGIYIVMAAIYMGYLKKMVWLK